MKLRRQSSRSVLDGSRPCELQPHVIKCTETQAVMDHNALPDTSKYQCPFDVARFRKFERLTNVNDFLKWKVEFQVIAKATNIWSLYLRKQSIEEPPSFNTFLVSSLRDAEYKTSRDSSTSILVQRAVMDNVWEVYNHRVLESRRREERNASAMFFLYSYVDSAVCAHLERANSPQDMYEKVCNAVKRSSADTLQELERLSIRNSFDMADFLNKLHSKHRQYINQGGCHQDEKLAAMILAAIEGNQRPYTRKRKRIESNAAAAKPQKGDNA